MSVTTSTFILKTASEGVVTATTDLNLTVASNKNTLSVILPSGRTQYTIVAKTYSSNSELVSALQSVVGDTFKVLLSGNKLRLSSDFSFTVDSSTVGTNNGNETTFGFPAAGVSSGNSNAFKSATFFVDFYPPSTITDNNVFMRLINAEISGTSVTGNRIPIIISINDLPQPVGTISENNSICTQSKILGIMTTNGTTNSGGRILTHIPDGLQTLSFTVKQLHDTLPANYLSTNMTICLVIEFEVSTQK